jgi:hypothetical protein
VSGVPRSQALIHDASTTGNVVFGFTCPAGYVTLVKTAYLFNSTSTTVEAVLYVGSPAFGGVLRILDASMVANGEAAWSGWVVLNPGDFVGANLGVAGVVLWVSGAVLAGPPQFPPG